MDPAGADGLLAGLDDAQRTAVTTPALPLCVLAGAGSGKTRVLTRRIAWRCATGAEDPRRVLALTFTRAAAVELGARLRTLGGRDPVRTGTFHAIAWAELRSREAERGRTPPVLVDRPGRLLARVVDDRGVAAAAAVELAWARARCIPLTRYPEEAARARRHPGIDPERVVAAGEAYEREKRKRHVVDFDDLLEHLTRALRHDPGFAEAQRWRFSHLYVDEFQDINPLQHQLLEEWRGGREGLTAVGDPNQAIYGWNGSDPSFIEHFTDLYPGAAVCAIDANYRSGAPILAVANAVLDAGRLGGVRLRAFRDGGAIPEVAGYDDEEAESRAVARAVLDAKLPGTTWGQQAVLARTNALLGPIEAALMAVGVPVRVRGRTAFGDRPVVRAGLRELSAAGARFADAVASLAATLPPPEELDRDDDGPGAVARVPAPDDGEAQEQDDLARFVELAERYLREHQPAEAAGFRGWLLSEVDDTDAGDGVDLATFHAAKGREWQTVHIVAAEDGYVPLARARTAAATTEERRLFYVACTRAERQLRVTWAASRVFGARGRQTRSRSPYLDELAPLLDRLRVGEAPTRPASPLHVPLSTPTDGALRSRTEALTQWRDRRARAAGIAPHALLPDAVLATVAGTDPPDAEGLAAIAGTRSLVLAGFTDEILDTLRGCVP
jgi:DNA helicase-2/ATP-dependent DNA helicase PcrA